MAQAKTDDTEVVPDKVHKPYFGVYAVYSSGLGVYGICYHLGYAWRKVGRGISSRSSI